MDLSHLPDHPDRSHRADEQQEAPIEASVETEAEASVEVPVEASAEEPREKQSSDELLAADDLRLPEGAAIAVRLHAVRAWLARRLAQARLAVGEAALHLQELAAAWEETAPARRREPEERARMQQRERRAQADLREANLRLQAYEEAAALLEEYVNHSGGERVLVDYYLALSELVESEAGSPTAAGGQPGGDEQGGGLTGRLQVLLAVLRRVERVSLPPED